MDGSPGAQGTLSVPGIDNLQEIGRGGFSIVYRGHQADLGRDVAVKVVLSRGTPEASLERWRREIRAMARLSNHPNIVPVFAAGVNADGSPYLVMPYVPDGSLGDRLRAVGPLPAQEVTALGIKVAGALASAHAAGVLHRDIKPDNVLLSPYGEPQLTDFGIARLLDAQATVTGTVMATIPYASPEVLSGTTAGEASDVYSLGATLYACLTGEPPFPSQSPDESLIALMGRIVHQPHPDLRLRGVPDALAAVVSAAMAKEPAERVGTAEDLRLRLTEVLAQLGDPAAAAPVLADLPVTVVPPEPAIAPNAPGPVIDIRNHEAVTIVLPEDQPAVEPAGAITGIQAPLAATPATTELPDDSPTQASVAGPSAATPWFETLVPAAPGADPEPRAEPTLSHPAPAPAPSQATAAAPPATVAGPAVAAPVVPAEAPVGPPPGRHTREPSSGRRSRRGPAVLVALLVLLVIGAGAAFALNQDDSTPEAKPTTPSTEKPADTSTSTSTTTTARPATTTTAAPVTTVPPATAPEGDETIPGSPKAVARAYFGALSRGDFDAAYAMGSPDFQSKTDKTVYVNFWSAHRPTIVGPLRVSGNGDFRTVSFRLDTGGHQENYNLELVQIGGRWLINGPTPKSNN